MARAHTHTHNGWQGQEAHWSLRHTHGSLRTRTSLFCYHHLSVAAATATPLERRPGAEQQPWVQSQTTFAVLHREEDGSFAVRTAKQKIWVEGVSYELQVRCDLALLWCGRMAVQAKDPVHACVCARAHK